MYIDIGPLPGATPRFLTSYAKLRGDKDCPAVRDDKARRPDTSHQSLWFRDPLKGAVLGLWFRDSLKGAVLGLWFTDPLKGAVLGLWFRDSLKGAALGPY